MKENKKYTKSIIKCLKCGRKYKNREKETFIRIKKGLYLCEDCFNKLLQSKKEKKE